MAESSANSYGAKELADEIERLGWVELSRADDISDYGRRLPA
jgi:hypothetical protein